MKKKLTLLPIVLASVVFGQTKPKIAKVPVFPGCEQYNKNQDLVSCFSSGAKGFTKTYFLLYKNLLDYFQFPSIDDQVYFHVSSEGRLEFKLNKNSTNAFNLMAKDYISIFNLYLLEHNLKIQPAKLENGESTFAKFNLPVVFYKKVKNLKEGIEQIRFTVNLDEQYVIKEDSNYQFTLYDEKGEVINRVNSIYEFYQTPIFKEVVKTDQNLITEQEVDGKKIKLEVFNLFKNQQNEFKILYFEDDKVIKEFNNMDAFLSSKYSKYIY